MNILKNKIKITVLLFAFAFNVYANGTGPFNQTYYDALGCDWKDGQPLTTYCFQDWFLFVFIPLSCDNYCDGTTCLGIFPGSDAEQTFVLEGDDICCEFIVTGQWGWSFDASGEINLGGSGVEVEFGWSDSDLSAGPFTEIPENLGGPGVTFELNTNLGGNLGAHYFQLCAATITIPGGFNGDANISTVLQFVYTLI